MSLLSVSNLTVHFRVGAEPITVVKDVSFAIERGQTLGIVGESGSGKSVTANSILRLLPPDAVVIDPGSKILFSGQDLGTMALDQLRRIRGNGIGMIFQEPMTSLNPLQSVRRQVGEPLSVHKGLKGRARDLAVLELLDMVQLGDAKRIMTALPFELSGGQRQRVMIAMALANRPMLLIADEPTTALDATIQAEILLLLKQLRRDLDMALLFITHDLPLVRAMADDVLVMERGVVVERGAAAKVLHQPAHAYTKRLVAAEPNQTRLPLGASGHVRDAKRLSKDPLIGIDDLAVHYPVRKGVLKRVVAHIRALDGVSLDIFPGETVGVLGESGSGKTTLGQAVLGLIPSTGGKVSYQGAVLTGRSQRQWHPLRGQLQIVFQDPFGSLSPRMSVREIVAEGLEIHLPNLSADALEDKVIDGLARVQLDASFADRYPHELSGGQRQRVSVARALILDPKFLVLDEPTSALDLSIQADLLALLQSIQDRFGIAYLFISHDLRVVRAMAHRVVVMKAGKVVETGNTAQVFDNPSHEYTKTLLQASLALGTTQGDMSQRRDPLGALPQDQTLGTTAKGA